MPKSLSKPRNAAFARQGGTCYYCGAPIWRDQPASFASRYGITERLAAHLQCTGEHLLARQDGGDDSPENIVAACRFCNENRHRRKRPPSPAVYRALIQERMRRLKWHPREIHRLLAIAQGRKASKDSARRRRRRNRHNPSQYGLHKVDQALSRS